MSITQQPNKKISLQLSLVAMSGLGLLWYIIYKASHTSFTHDESYTYTHYVHQGFMDIISYKTPYTNNHILNTVLIKYCEVFFGSSELSLRLPNIIAFIVYSVFSALLFFKYSPKLILQFYLIMVLNPYLLDFFALARGYGLSIGFLVMSLYYLSFYFTTKQNKHLILFNIGAFLAVMSNFSLLNYYVAAIITYNIISFIESKNQPLNNEGSYNFLKINKIIAISVLLSGMVLFEPLRRISKQKLLDFGGKNGFMEDTVSSIIYDFFYETNVTDIYLLILKGFTLVVAYYILVLIIKNALKKNTLFFKEQITLVVVNFILFAVVLITIAQHVFLENDFYEHRFALFFYPLFALNFIFLLVLLYKKEFIWLSSFACWILVGALLVNLYVNHNLIYFKDWKYNQNTKLVMQQLVKEHKNAPSNHTRLGINWLLEPSTNFYRYTWNLKWLNPTHRRGISKHDDYFYLFTTDKKPDYLLNTTTIYLNDLSGEVLLKNKR